MFLITDDKELLNPHYLIRIAIEQIEDTYEVVGYDVANNRNVIGRCKDNATAEHILSRTYRKLNTW